MTLLHAQNTETKLLSTCRIIMPSLKIMFSSICVASPLNLGKDIISLGTWMRALHYAAVTKIVESLSSKDVPYTRYIVSRLAPSCCDRSIDLFLLWAPSGYRLPVLTYAVEVVLCIAHARILTNSAENCLTFVGTSIWLVAPFIAERDVARSWLAE